MEENPVCGKLSSENISMRNFKRILVTGGAGFIGSAFVRYLLPHIECLVNLDLLTYAANLKNLMSIENDPRYLFIHGDILDQPLVEELIQKHQIEAIVHFAAESHVDRSIESPLLFYRTNVEGTLSLLEAVRKTPSVHFHHISTDEVYGSRSDGHFCENSPYCPNSPYAASKAASDHFVRAYANTYGISTTISHASNNYGPYQYAEKFIPRMIYGCLKKQTLPLYGNGTNVRDWIFVDDHARAVWMILQNGKIGENYNIGGGHQMRNVDLLHLLIDRFAQLQGQSAQTYRSLITYVQDRPGHDFRYALSGAKMEKELGWTPSATFDQAIETTIKWYLDDWK